MARLRSLLNLRVLNLKQQRALGALLGKLLRHAVSWSANLHCLAGGYLALVWGRLRRSLQGLLRCALCQILLVALSLGVSKIISLVIV